MMIVEPAPRDSRCDPWLLAVFVLTVLMCLPFLRMVYALGDEGILLNGAERMLHGEHIYNDFFEFLPPGGFIFTAWWFRISGISVLSARVLGFLVFAGLACVTYVATRQPTRNAPYSLILTMIWVAASQGPQTQLSHHWLTTCFSMIAFCAALSGLDHPPRRSWLAVWAGAMSASAVMITPTCGVLAWLAAASFFLRQRRPVVFAYLAGSAIAPLAALAFLLAQHDLAWAYADCIRFPAAHYASVQGTSFGFWTDRQTYPLLDLFPLAGFLTFIMCLLKGWRCLREHRLQLCLAFAMAGFIGCFPRPDIVHISYNALLCLPLFAYAAAAVAQQCRPRFVAVLRYVLILLFLPSTLAYFHVAYIALCTPPTPTPRGAIAIFGDTGAAQMIQRMAVLPPGARFFFYPYQPYMSFITVHEQVSKFDLFTPGYTLPSQYQDACFAVMRNADYVVVDRRWNDPAWVQGIFPAIKNTNPPETQGFNEALNHGFDLIAVDTSFELRHRNTTASAALCTGIAG